MVDGFECVASRYISGRGKLPFCRQPATYPFRVRIDRATGEHANLGKALFAIMVVIFTLLVCLFPIQKFADYTNASVNITASVSLTVRSASSSSDAIGFDEPYCRISFRLPGLPSDAELEVMLCGLFRWMTKALWSDWLSLRGFLSKLDGVRLSAANVPNFGAGSPALSLVGR